LRRDGLYLADIVEAADAIAEVEAGMGKSASTAWHEGV
jgi:hypothetical protein